MSRTAHVDALPATHATHLMPPATPLISRNFCLRAGKGKGLTGGEGGAKPRKARLSCRWLTDRLECVDKTRATGHVAVMSNVGGNKEEEDG
jgi:hypothetical protein